MKVTGSKYLLVGLAVSFALFSNGIRGDFVFDDAIVIVGNPIIERGISGVVEAFRSPYHAYQPKTGLYRPLTIFSYSLNYAIFGTSPVSFHVVNIVLHGLVGFFIFLVLQQIGGKRAAILGMLLFLAFPIHVEDVTSIVGRAELLALLFVLAALYSAMRHRYILASCMFLLGILSKESAIVFLPMWLAWEYFFNKQTIRTILKRFLIMILAISMYAVLRYLALGEYFLANDATPTYNALKFATIPQTLWPSGKIFFLYLQKTLFPTVFSPDYSLFQIPLLNSPLASWESIVGIVLLVGCIVIAWRNRRSPLGWFVLFFLSSYFIISNLVFKTGTIMAERILYPATFGLAAMTAYGIEWLRQKWGHEKVIYASVTLLLLFYGFKTIQHNRDWISETNLFQRAYASAPLSIPNRVNHAYLAYRDNNYARAVDELEATLTVVPDHVPALHLAGQAYKKMGNVGKAEEYWKKAVALQPDYLAAYLGLGMLYYEQGHFASAEAALDDAVAVFPRSSEVAYLSLAKTGLKKYDEAISIVENYFGKNPGQVELRLALGIAWYKKGDKERASEYISADYFPTIEKNSIFRIIDL